MFFDDEDLVSRKSATLALPPPIPETGWRTPQYYPNLSSAAAIAFDVETKDPLLDEYGPGWATGHGHIVGFSVAVVTHSRERGKWYFPVRHEVEREYNLDPRIAFAWLKTVLETPHIPKFGANLLYDIGWLTTENIWVTGELNDVQFAEALIDEDAFVSLDILAHKYLGRRKTTNIMYEWIHDAYKPKKSKERAEIYRTPPRLVGHYGEDDADLPLDIFKEQAKELTNQELWHVYKLENRLIPLLIRMRLEGVTVDRARAHRMHDELSTEIRELYARVKSEYGYGISGTHTGQLSKLFDHVGISYPKTSAGNASIQKEFLKGLEHPLGELINDIREHEKIQSTFIKSYILEKSIPVPGTSLAKLYPQFHPLKGDVNGTKVGRFASSDPNLQNIPSRTKLGKKVREAFVAHHGCAKWRKHDYSQIHYRILAHFAVDEGDGSAERLRQRYICDPATDYHMDVYKGVAPLLGWSLEDEEEIKVRRRPIKNVNFGLLYGQSEKALAYKAGFTGEQAKFFFKSYHEGAPYVLPTMRAIAGEVQEFGYVRTILGRRVRFSLWEPVSNRDRVLPLPYELAVREYGTFIKRAFDYRGVNYKFQGSEPDIMKTGMIKLLDSGVFDYTGVPMITVHDEMDWSMKDESRETLEAFDFIKHTMETAVSLRVPIKVDATVGPSWGKAD